MRQQLRAEAHAEHGQPSRDRLAQQLRFRGQQRVAVDLADRLIAPEGHDPIRLVGARQGVAVEQPALVELGP